MPLPVPKLRTLCPEIWTAQVLLSHSNPGGDSESLVGFIQAIRSSPSDIFREVVKSAGESCSFVERPSDVWDTHKPPWQFKERLAKVFIVPEDVPDFKGNWEEIANHQNELVEGYRGLGYEVEVYDDGSSESLLKTLRGRVDHKALFAHADRDLGIRCTDHFVSWDEIVANIGPTGLAHFLPCWSYDADCWDGDDSCPFIRGLLDAGCSAAILSHNEGHHIPGEAESGGIFEIQRVLWQLRRCHEVGLRAAMDDYRRGYYCNGEVSGTILTDHEVAAGDPRWGISD